MSFAGYAASRWPIKSRAAWAPLAACTICAGIGWLELSLSISAANFLQHCRIPQILMPPMSFEAVLLFATPTLVDNAEQEQQQDESLPLLGFRKGTEFGELRSIGSIGKHYAGGQT